MTDLLIHPGLILILGGLFLPFFKGTIRNLVLGLLPVISLYLIWQLPDGVSLKTPFLGYDLILIQTDALTRLFATIFAIAGFAGAIFAFNQQKTSELAAAFIYAGSAIGVTFCGDLISLFIFWEIMAVASTVVILSAGQHAHAPAIRYAIIHFLGGVILMAGIAGEIQANGGNIAFVNMTSDNLTISRMLILGGFLINAGAVPFSAWLPDAYPSSSWSGAVFLSAFTTKTAVYVLLRGFPGTEILIYIGMYMILYGIIYAILENDIRRILVYSIVNQVGFMLVAAGIGSEFAVNGAASHAFSHILYKALLLMSAGSVIYMTGKSKCTELGGLFRTMPLTAVCAIVGGLAISAFPWTSGFVSKSLIAKSVIKADLFWPWIVVSTASACAFLYVGLKFPWFVFFHKDSGLRPAEPPLSMRVSMIILVVMCVGIGLYPQALYGLLPSPVKYDPYSLAHIVSQLQLLLFAALAFFILVAIGIYKVTPTITLDLDWFYRRFGLLLGREFNIISEKSWNGIVASVSLTSRTILKKLYESHGPRGIFARSWPTGGMAFWTTVLLAAYLLLYYI